jgi:cell wall-associated NlpC family hydrolase
VTDQGRTCGEAVTFLGLPYREGATGPDAYDCWGAVHAFLASIGRGDAVPHADRWKPLGSSVTDARRVGDVVLTAGPEGRQGVAVAIQASPLRFLTATPEHGVHTVPPRSLAASAIGAYRWEPAT